MNLNAPYLYRHRTSGYIFRLCVPKELTRIIGQTEYRYSMRTESSSRAKHRAGLIASFIHSLFDDIKRMIKKMDKLIPTKEQIKEIVRDYIRNTLNNDEKLRSGMSIPIELRSPVTGSNMGKEETESLLTSVNRWLVNEDHSLMNYVVPDEYDIEDDGGLSRELLKAFQSILKVRIKRSQGDYSEADSTLIPSIHSNHAPINNNHQPIANQSVNNEEPTVQPDRPQELTFNQLKDLYVDEKMSTDPWTAKTNDEYDKSYKLFMRIVGSDIPVNKIDRLLINKFKTTLLKLPPSINSKGSKFKGMSIEDIIAQNESEKGKTLHPKTINTQIVRIGSVCIYGARNGFMDRNPTEGIRLKITKSKDQDRKPFTIDELNELLKPTKRQAKLPIEKRGYHYWSTRLALYTGARLDEICQLYLSDIKQDGDIWYIDINDDGPEKKLKNQSSRRLVPIHPDLIEMGLLQRVEYIKNTLKHHRLFPDLKRSEKAGYSPTVSKWFTKHRKACGVIEEGKTFHSFRHTFITGLKYAKVDHVMISELDGHAVQGEFSRYGKKYPVDQLYRDAIVKLNYDLS